MQQYIRVYTTSEVGTGEKVFKLNPKIGTREREFMTTGTVGVGSKNDETKNSFCHLLGNYGTTTTFRFRLLSNRVRRTIY